MTVKSVLVRLRGDNGDLNRALLGSAGAARVLSKNLNDGDDSARRLSDSLNVSNERTTMLVQSMLALGPALVPIGAQAVPMVMGLATQLTFAAGAAGVTALAFSGIGDSLKAVNDYALDPTEAHLEKMNEELGKLGPAGRDFVMYLQTLRPELQKLQDVAQAEMLPGVQESIEELMTMLPQVERIVGTIAGTLGDLSAEAGEALAGPEWEDFFTYVETQAQPILTDFSRTIGNLIQGAANMIVAFDPLTRDFSEGFLQMSRDFEAWSRGLAESEGFENFVSYIRETGPQVWETLGSVSMALIELLKAAAPVGDVVLPVLEILADSVSALANSPAGPALIGIAAGLSAVSRAIALYQMANGTALAGLLSKLGVEGGKAALGARAAGVGLGMLALSLTDLDEKMGLSNTAMFAMMGMMAGPWGAAAGAAAGAAMDAAAANDDFAAAVERADAILSNSSSTLAMQSEAVRRSREELDQMRESLTGTWSWIKPSAWKNSWEGVLGLSDIEEAEAKHAELERQLSENRSSFNMLTGVIDQNSDGFVTNTDAILENVDAMRRQREEALRAYDAETNYAATLLESAEAAEEYGKVLKRNGDARKGHEEEAISARRTISAEAAAWNDLSDEAKNAPGAYRAAKRSLVDLATGFGMSRTEARKLIKAIMDVPPKSITAYETPGLDEAISGALRVRELAALAAGTYDVTFRYLTTGQIPAHGGSMVARADGGEIPGQRYPYGDKVLAYLAPGEEVISNRYGQADRFRADRDSGRIPRYADGGTVGGWPSWPGGTSGGGSSSGGLGGYNLDQQLELLRLQEQINSLRKDLSADGKDSLKGIAREIAALELRSAQRDLREARRAPIVDLREQMGALRDISLEDMGVEEMRDAMRQFRSDVREAGGVWTKQLSRMARNMIAAARAAERTQRHLDRESERREKIVEKLDEEIRALEQVKQAMDSYSQSVAGNFLNDPFNGSRATTSGGGGGGGGSSYNPEAAAALVAAEARLGAIRSNESMDPLWRSYEASKTLAEIEALREQVGDIGRASGGVAEPVDQAVSGLEALRQTLIADTKAAEEFVASLTALSAAGLNPGLFQQLAASGDTGTAAELAGLGSSGLAEINGLWQAREQAAAQVATFATQQVFGAQLDAATAAVVATEKTLAATDATIRQLNQRLENLGQRVENGAERGVASLARQIESIREDIRAIPRQMQTTKRKG